MFLNCHSYHSLRYGTLSIEELVSQATNLGIKELVLTDINTISGIYDFKIACEQNNIKPYAGVEIRKNNNLLYITIAKNFSGIGEINKMLTNYNCYEKEIPISNPYFKNVFVIYPIENVPIKLLDNEFIGIKEDQLSLLIKFDLKKYLNKIVILQPITISSQKKEYNLHRILRAIDENTLISKLEMKRCCKPTEFLKPISSIFNAFYNYPQIINNTKNLLAQCSFNFDYKIPRNKKHYTDSNENDLILLTKLAYKGMYIIYGKDNEEAIQRIEKELKVIDHLKFCSYFLITWDIIQYSNSKGFMHVGRGSGANSIVSYCLGITNICPIELNLYFERFLNLNRKSPPDFDIDWSWQDRDTILKYIFDRYGKDHVAFCGVNVEFKYRSIIREVGKAFGLPKDELDALVRNPSKDYNENPLIKVIQKYGRLLEKYPNQRSMHSCGILITEEPISNYSALEMPPKGFPIIQFDMQVAEEIGFEKFDILSQRGLGTINDTVELVKKNCGIDINIRDISISKDEKLCNENLAIGNTIGCFYIESPAMRSLLVKLKCNNYKTLVAASSIIRPGVAKSGMMREFIFRHNNPNKFEYFHKVFEDQLGETYGIMVYQEDVIKIALYFGGLSASDGDILRRAMSGKSRSISALQEVKNHFFESCKKLGHSEKLTQEVYRQIESFAGYSFCKAHSASYAVESYQTLYLKVRYPLEFLTSVINNMGGYYKTEVYVHEAKMSGGVIQNPCVNMGYYETSLNDKNIFIGFRHLQSLDIKIGHLIVKEREKNGLYSSLKDFIGRVSLGLEALQILIFIGAFRFTGKPKNELLIEARLLLTSFKIKLQDKALFDEPIKEYKLPKLKRSLSEDAFDEIELLGFPISCSPFDLLQTKYRGSVFVKDLYKHHKRNVKMLAYLISKKNVYTKKGIMTFGTWIDAHGNYFDTAHFPNLLTEFPFQGDGCYLLLGLVEVDFNFPTITVIKMAKMPMIPDPRYINTI